MKILANDLKPQFEMFQKEYEDAALKVLRSGWYILGQEVQFFEEEFAKYNCSKYCVGLASGLDALWISFKILGIQPEDEIIVASNAYIACFMGITMAGGQVKLVEPGIDNNIDVSKIEEAITPNTKGILAVHLFGRACNMDVIQEIANKHNLYIVEDCSQAHGTEWKNKKVGTFGTIGCFSGYPTKGLGAFGDAGYITTDNLEIAEKFKTYRNYGSKIKYENEIVGTNSRLDEIQAALLRVKLGHLDALIEERRLLANRYLKEIKTKKVELPVLDKNSYDTWHQFTVKTNNRQQFIEDLSNAGIGTMIHYPIPPHLSKAYAYLGFHKGDFPVAEKYAQQILSLPMYNGMTVEEQTYIINTINTL